MALRQSSPEPASWQSMSAAACTEGLEIRRRRQMSPAGLALRRTTAMITPFALQLVEPRGAADGPFRGQAPRLNSRAGAATAGIAACALVAGRPPPLPGTSGAPAAAVQAYHDLPGAAAACVLLLLPPSLIACCLFSLMLQSFCAQPWGNLALRHAPQASLAWQRLSPSGCCAPPRGASGTTLWEGGPEGLHRQ